MKLNIKIEKDWLEATWLENEIQIHCESFSGHREHIQMLRAKALELGTSLDEYEAVIAECESKFVYPSDEELARYELDNKIQEANSYLSLTDWVKDYKLRHDLRLELIPETSSKWIVIAKREEYLLFLKGL